MKPQSPLSLRLEPALLKRLEECSERTHIKKYTLAIMAIEAAVEAIEKNGFRLVVPIQFNITRVPIEKGHAEAYPSRQDEGVLVEERPIKSDSNSGADTERKVTEAFRKDLARDQEKRGVRPKGKQ